METQVLGITFNKVSAIPHLQALKSRCLTVVECRRPEGFIQRGMGGGGGGVLGGWRSG